MSNIKWRNDGSGLGDWDVLPDGIVMHDCVHRLPIQGAKAGQKQPKRPSIADDTIASISRLKALYLLSEGEIKGLANGAASIELEGTPLVDDSGNPNFEGIEWEIRTGTVDQEHIAGMPSASNEVGINTTLSSDTPYIRKISNTQLSSVNVNISFPLLKQVEDDGDVVGVTVAYAIDVQTDGMGYVTMLNTSLKAKTSGRYQKTHNVKLPEAQTSWQIRVRKITADGNNETLFNAMQIDSMGEIIDVKLTYPCSALLYLSFDAKTFNNIPKIAVDTMGAYVQVPTNYDPVTRTSTGIWDGTFKLGYTTNPAWHYYNLITNDRYGLGDKLQPFMIDKWSLEYIARICDEPVDDGNGGTEPRFTCNLYLQKSEDAYQVLQHIAGIFRGMSFWNGSQIVVDADTARDCEYVITRANVIGGAFVKTGSAASDRHTIAKVAYSNPANNYETDYAMVRNEQAIAQYGINVLDLSAVGCTSEGQAYRMGLAALLAETNRTQTVSFAMGLDGSLPSVASRIDIADMMFTGANTGGRISSVSSNRKVITVDRDNVPVTVGDKLIVNLETGKAQERVITAINGRAITVALAFDAVAAQNVWAINSDTMPTMPFIVMSVVQNEDGTQYNYTAMQYDPTMYSQIDNGTIIEQRPPVPSNNPYIIDAPDTVALNSRHRVVQGITVTTLEITWSQVKDAVAYDVEWRKDDGDWIKLPSTANISAEIDGVYSGNYLARVRAVSAFDAISKPTTSMLTAVTGKTGTPPTLAALKATGLLFGMQIDWTFAPGSGDTAYTEIQVASAPDVNVAALGQHAYPTNSAVINGLQGGLTQYYRARIVDKLGNKSPWTAWISGTTDANADKVLDLIQGQINESSLNTSLTTKIDKIEANKTTIDAIGIDLAAANAALNKAKTDIASANASIASNKTELSTAITAANLEIAKAKTDIASANASIAGNKTELSTAITAANLEIAKAKTDIVAAKGVADAALADAAANKTSLVSLTNTVGANKTSVDASITTLANKDLSLTNLYTALKSEYDTNKAAVTNELTALTNKDLALVSDISKLTTKTNNTNAEIVIVKNLVSSNTSSIAQTKTDLTADYTQAINNIEIGGRNLLLDSASLPKQRPVPAILNINNVGVFPVGNAQLFWNQQIFSQRLYAGENYTWSMMVACEGSITGLSIYYGWGYQKMLGIENINSSAFVKVWFTFKSSITTFDSARLHFNVSGTEGSKLYFTNLKLEKGSKATDWSPAPEDIDKALTVNTAAITAESVARADADSAITSSIATLKSDYDANKASVTQSLGTLTNKDTALTNQLTALTATVGTNTANITTNNNALVAKDKALADAVTALDTDYKGNKTSVSNSLTALSNADTALGNRITATDAIAKNAQSRVGTAETAISTANNAIANTKTELTAAYTQAIGNLEIGGRNLILRNTESLDTWVSVNGTVQQSTNHATTDYIKVVPGSTLTFNKESVEGLADPGGYFRWAWYSENKTYLSRKAETAQGAFTWKVPENTYFIRVSYPTKSNPKVEKGNKPTDWSPAPEDVEADYNAKISTEAMARSNAINSVTSLITTLDTDYKGNKSTVNNSLSALSSADTALTNSINSLTTKVGNNTTNISQEVTARSSADTALGNRITTVEGKTDNALARIGTVETISASNTQSIAQTKTEITASYKQAIDDVEIGGRNLMLDSLDFGRKLGRGYGGIEPLFLGKTDVGYVNAPRSTMNSFNKSYSEDAVAGNPYTFSIMASYIGAKPRSIQLYGFGGGYTNLAGIENLREGTFIRLWLTRPKFTGSYKYNFHLHVLTDGDLPSKVYFAEAKVEKGNKPTDWSPAPEDLLTSLESNTASIVTESLARSNAIDSVTNLITTLDSDYKGNKSTVSNSLTTLTNKDTALTNSLNSLTTTVGSNTTKITNEVTARSDADTALGNRITATDAIAKNAQSRVGTAETAISTANNAIATLRTDLAASFSVADTRNTNQTPTWYITNYPKQIVREFKTSSVIGILGGGYSYLETTVKYGDASGGKVTQEATTDSGIVLIRSGAGTAWGSWLEQEDTAGSAAKVAALKTALDRDIGIVDARVTEEKKVAANATSAVASTVSALQTTVSGHTASIQTAQSSINGLSAQYTLKIDVGGRVSGFGLASSATQSDFAIRADKFYIAAPTGSGKGRSVFTVLSSPTVANGVTIPAGTYLDGDLLATGTITGDKITAYSTLTAPNINGGQININNNFIVDSNGNVTAKSGTFEGTVLAEKISGTIDVESMKRSAWTPGYSVYYSKSINHNYTHQFDKTYPSNRPSRGSIDVYYSGEGKYYTAAMLFEIDLLVKTPTVVKQMVNVADDFLDVVVNGLLVSTVNDTSILVYNNPKTEVDTTTGYTAYNKNIVPLTYTLPAGKVKLQFLLHNTGGPIALILAGDFIDNDNVKFA